MVGVLNPDPGWAKIVISRNKVRIKQDRSWEEEVSGVESS